MSYEYLHEVETVVFLSDPPRRVADLIPTLENAGFTLHDDVFSLDRTDRAEPWQHSSVITFELMLNGKEVFDIEDGLWDTLHLKYLFAFLPFEHAKQFIEVVFSLAQSLLLPALSRQRETTPDALRRQFEDFREELRHKVGEEPGSEKLVILIRSTYPR